MRQQKATRPNAPQIPARPTIQGIRMNKITPEIWVKILAPENWRWNKILKVSRTFFLKFWTRGKNILDGWEVNSNHCAQPSCFLLAIFDLFVIICTLNSKSYKKFSNCDQESRSLRKKVTSKIEFCEVIFRSAPFMKATATLTRDRYFGITRL